MEIAMAKDLAEHEPEQRPSRGRPTKYDPAFCDRIIEMGAYGASMAEMCLEMRITHPTWYAWVEEHEDFSTAVKHARELARGWWEMKGRVATFNAEGFNSTSFIFNMKNRFRDDWKDVSDHNVKSSATNLNVNTAAPVEASIPELVALLAQAASPQGEGVHSEPRPSGPVLPAGLPVEAPRRE
jgi:hypothetical protein